MNMSKIRFLSVLILACLLAALPVSPAEAQGTIIYVDASATGADDGSSWLDAYNELQSALAPAVSGDEIWVANGTYLPTTGVGRAVTFQLKNGVAIYGGFAGGETTRSQRNSDPETNNTLLSCDLDGDDPANLLDNCYHVVTGSGTDNTAVLDGFTIHSANADGAGYDYTGGGMFISGGSPTLTNIIFSGNRATYGAGLYNSAGSPALTNVVFADNIAVQQGGGLVNTSGGAPTLTNILFTGNEATYGGGMYTASGNAELTNVVFSSNIANRGGGLYSYDSPTLTDVTFLINTANEYGGGVQVSGGAPVFTRVTFDANSASVWGGGMVITGSTTPLLRNVTFTNNTATYNGGGIYNSGHPTLINVTLSNNHALELGTRGGGFYNDTGNPVIRNTILWGNSAPSSPDIFVAGGAPAIYDSVVAGGCPVGLTCTNVIDANPQLGTFGSYGGLTQIFPLESGSSAIDAGDNDHCASPDQRGLARPQDGDNNGVAICDIGAFEVEDSPPTVINSVRLDGSPTNAASVRFLVTFSEPVTGLQIQDFTGDILSGMLTGINWTFSSGCGADLYCATYTVTINTGSGEGEFRLNVRDDGTIVDAFGHPLGGPGNQPYTGGASYVIDKVAPETVIDSQPDNPSNSADATFAFSSADTTATFECQLDGGGYSTCALSQDYFGLADGSHTFEVRAVDSIGNAEPTPATYTWTVNTVSPILQTPADDVVLLHKRPAFVWSEVPSATEYKIQVSRSNTFDVLAINVNVTDPTYTPAADLGGNRVHYWRARARVSGVWGSWSETRSFTTGRPPSVPVLVSPANDAFVVSTPLLDWNDSTVPTGVTFREYKVQIAAASEPDFDPLIVDTTTAVGNVTASSYAPATLSSNSEYLWRVQAVSEAGHYSAWSEVRSFRIAIESPALGTPLDDAILITRRPALDWGDVTGADDGYKLVVSRYADLSTPLLNVNVMQSAYSEAGWTFDLPANKVIYWRVRGQGLNGPSAWSETRSFTTGAVPSTPVLVSPVNGVLITSSAPVLDWDASTLPAGTTFTNYLVQVTESSNPDFAGSLLVDEKTTLGDIADSSYTLGSLAPDTKYIWRIRAVNDVGDSGWSEVWTFSTSIAAPALSTPGNGDVLTTRRPALDWGDVTGATQYKLVVSRNADLSTPLLNVNLTESAYNETDWTFDLPGDRVIYWRVRTQQPNGPSAWSETRSFITGAVPSTPVLVLPVDNALVRDYTPALDWNDSSVPAGTIFTNYQVQVTDQETGEGNPDFTGSLPTDVVDSTYTTAALTPSTKYYWRVRALSNAGASSWSTEWSFRTALLPPANLIPASGTVGNLRPPLNWDVVTDADGYIIQISTSSTFDAPLVNTTASTNSFTPGTGLPAGTRIYWRVRATGTNGPSSWSATASFRTP